MYLKGCEGYGLKTQDLFQVNDLYENKNLYMIVDNLFTLGGQVILQLVNFGPAYDVSRTREMNKKREFDIY